MANFNDMFGNPNTEGMNQETPNVKRTDFNLSTSQFMQHIEGAIQPIDCIKLLPNTKGTANYQIKIKLRNPSVRPLKNGMRFYVHGYLAKNKDLWDGWKPYLSQKISGETNVKVPVIDFWGSNSGSPGDRNSSNYVWTSLTPNSLANCLGIPWECYTTYYEQTTGGTTYKARANNRYCFRPTPIYVPNADANTIVKDKQYTVDQNLTTTDFKINALPFVAYQKIRRKYYMNFNDLWNNNGKKKSWYPLLEEDFKLPITSNKTSGGENWVNILNHNAPWADTDESGVGNNGFNCLKKVNTVDIQNGDITINDFTDPNYDLMTEVPHLNGQEGVSGNVKEYPYLNSLGFRQVKGDYFTSGSPFPMLMRDGVQPSTSADVKHGDVVGSKFINLLGLSDDGTLTTVAMGNSSTNAILKAQVGGTVNFEYASGTSGTTGGITSNSWNSVGTDTHLTNLNKMIESFGISMADLRMLTTMTKFKEKMGRISRLDYYNGVIESTFACNPNADNGDPIYVGGGSGSLGTFAEKSTNNTFNTAVPNGDIGNGECTLNINVGDFATNDHAYLIVVLSSQIDTIYPRALDRMWTTISYEQEYFPDFNALEPQATLRKEKDFAITNRDDVLNYQDRYCEYKTRLSKVVGLGQSKSQIWDNYQYLTMTDEWYKADNNALSHTLHPRYLDNSVLTVTNEPMFDVDILKNVKVTAPLPYKAVPMEL